MIKRLKKEEWDIICSDDSLGRNQTAEERIESYKRKKKIMINIKKKSKP